MNMTKKLILLITIAFSFVLCCFSEEIKLELKRQVKIAGKTFGEKDITVCCYDLDGTRSPAQTKQYTVLLPIEKDLPDDLACIALCADDNFFYKQVIKGDGLVTHQKIMNKANEILDFSISLPFTVDVAENNRLLATVYFLVRRALEIVLMHMKNDIERIGISPNAHEFISKREFTAGLANADTAVELYNLLMRVKRTGMNYAVNVSDNNIRDIVLATRKIVLQWANQFDEKAKSLPKDEYAKYVVLDQQQQQRQNQVNNQILQLLMMNHQQNMRVASEVNATMNSRNTPTPKLKTPQGYCARHNCHYDLTQGCHFCRSPNYGGSTNPWRVRGNWDGEIK